MTAKAYNEIDDFFYKIEENTKAVCVKNNIDFNHYLGSFVTYLIKNYVTKKMHINTINELNFKDKLFTRAILNKNNIGSKRQELQDAFKSFKIAEEKLFTWLDERDNPYYFILNPVYNFGWKFHDKKYGYTKERNTGFGNIDIAYDYLKYKLSKNN